jgi:hypothetical protein
LALTGMRVFVSPDAPAIDNAMIVLDRVKRRFFPALKVTSSSATDADFQPRSSSVQYPSAYSPETPVENARHTPCARSSPEYPRAYAEFPHPYPVAAHPNLSENALKPCLRPAANLIYSNYSQV